MKERPGDMTGKEGLGVKKEESVKKVRLGE